MEALAAADIFLFEGFRVDPGFVRSQLFRGPAQSGNAGEVNPATVIGSAPGFVRSDPLRDQTATVGRVLSRRQDVSRGFGACVLRR
jgi:hypothetical protein